MMIELNSLSSIKGNGVNFIIAGFLLKAEKQKNFIKLNKFLRQYDSVTLSCLNGGNKFAFKQKNQEALKKAQACKSNRKT